VLARVGKVHLPSAVSAEGEAEREGGTGGGGGEEEDHLEMRKWTEGERKKNEIKFAKREREVGLGWVGWKARRKRFFEVVLAGWMVGRQAKARADLPVVSPGTRPPGLRPALLNFDWQLNVTGSMMISPARSLWP